MKKNKTIAIFTGYYLPFLGGIERYTEKLIKHLNHLGYNIIIVTSNYDNLKEFEQNEYYSIYRLPVYSLFCKRYPIIKKNKDYKRILQELSTKQIDAIICNTRFHLTSLIGGKFAKKYNIPVLAIEHGSNHFTVNNKILDFFGQIYEHLLTNHLKRYIKSYYGVSERCNKWLKHFNIDAKGVFYNSVEKTAYDKFKNKTYLTNNKGKTIITYAGRLIKEKGIMELLEAYSNISKNYKNLLLVIAGDGPLLDQLKEKYHNQKDIKFVGKLNYDEVMALYNNTDIFVYPSMYPEGLPTSILEAGIMKCAIVATDRGGTIEVINNEKYGRIAQETVEDIERQICTYLDNNDIMIKCKENIHQRINEEFTWDVTANKIANVLEEIINEKN
jgi:glycosyltransferase, group 1 family